MQLTMPTKATTWSGYRWRLALIAAICLGFATWSLYDGFVRYPSYNRMLEQYQGLPEETQDDDWPSIAAERGWPTNPLDLPAEKKSVWDIRTQFIMTAITLPIGLIFAFAVIRTFNRWIALDEQGLNTSWGQCVPFEAITKLNKRRWHKGIAVVYHQDGPDEQKLVLDDWKYQRETMDSIVEQIEASLSPDQILNPKHSTPPSAEAAADEQIQKAEDQTPSQDEQE